MNGYGFEGKTCYYFL